MATRIKGKKAFHTVVLILLGIFLFILFLYVGFPYETLKRRIIGELEAKTPFLYEIEEVRPYPLLGLTFKNAVIYASVGSKKVKLLGIERFRVTVSPIPLFWRKVHLLLWGRILGGTVEGEAARRGDHAELTLLGRDVNIQQIHILKDAAGMELTGMLRGETAITLGGGDISQQSGTAEFVVTEAVLSRCPLPGLAPLRVGRIQGGIELKLGRLIIQRLAFSGGDVEGKVLGNIILGSHFFESRLNLRITIKPKVKFDPKYQVLLSLLGRQGRTEGSYAFSLRGTLLRPRLATQ